MKKLINKMMTTMLAATMALSMIVQVSFAEVTPTATWETTAVYNHAANGNVTNIVQNDGTGNLYTTTYYNALGKESKVTDSKGTIMQSCSYDGNGLLTQQNDMGYDDKQIATGQVTSTFFPASGIQVTVNEGAATLTDTGLTGGNAVTASEVATNLNNILAGTSNGGNNGANGWDNLIAANLNSVTVSGSVLASMTDLQVNLLSGYHEAAVSQSDVLTAAAANKTSSFTFTFAADGGKGNRVSSIKYVTGEKADGTANQLTIDRSAVMDTDPLVTGKIEGVKIINGQAYAEVQANGIDMFNGKGQQSADGETVMVAIDAATAASLSGKTGQEITVSGNVTTNVDGHLTMTMNQGGYVTGVVGSTLSTWMDQNQSFYNSTVSAMIKTYNSLGVGNSSWQAQWSALEGAQTQANF